MTNPNLNPSIRARLEEIQSQRRIPRATYRLQFGPDLTFDQAQALAPYLFELGISDCYASPILAACPGSTHGYSICDYGQLNPDLGGQPAFDALAAALAGREMGLVLDVVPNHMGIASPGNNWWMDVLENGPGSLYAQYFDIDWRPVKKELEHKVLLPVLEDQYGQVLENGKLALGYEDGSFFVCYGPLKLPVAPGTYSQVLTPCLEKLLPLLDEGHEHVLEFQSILTALNYLPSRMEQEPERLAERNREKEIIKRRLAALTQASPEVRSALEATVASFQGQEGDPASFDQLHDLLEAQPYRLAFWRVAAEEINYRRFFDINDLAAIREELPEVFEASHELTFRLLAQGQATGLRIDHPDGLWNPLDYFRQLQESYLLYRLQAGQDVSQENSAEELRPAIAAWLETLAESRAEAGMANPAWPLYVVAEKILTENEPLPQNWAVNGTTGYDFLNAVNGLFVDSSRERDFNRLYHRFSGNSTRFAELAHRTKEMIMRASLASEINTLSNHLERINEQNRRYRDFTLPAVTAAIRAVIASLSIYRTYITEERIVSERDQRYIEAAVAEARRRNPQIPRPLFKFLGDTLLLRNLAEFRPEDQHDVVNFVMKFQQVSGPLMAKGLEDTAFYIYNRLVSLNEVGGHPERFGLSVAEFHQRNADRRRDWPHALLASSTHDTKRSEDARARLNVLSEIPGEWQQRLSRWRRLNAGHKTGLDGDSAPDSNDEYLFYQAILGAWPFAAGREPESPLPVPLMAPSGEGLAAFRERILAYLQKATKEAKVHTSWINPDEGYDKGIENFINRSLDEKEGRRFLADLLPFASRIAYFGQFNSLAQLLLKLTSPGVPDIYQGAELWDLSLVDPDNRRPVDYDLRRRLLAELKDRVQAAGPAGLPGLAGDLLAHSYNGQVKLYVTERVLSFRRDHAGLFAEGDYYPVETSGDKAAHVCAFSRSRAGETVLIVVPRLIVGLTGGQERPPLGAEVWGDTRLHLPQELAGRPFVDIFTGQTLPVDWCEKGAGLPLANVLEHFPVALLATGPQPG